MDIDNKVMDTVADAQLSDVDLSGELGKDFDVSLINKEEDFSSDGDDELKFEDVGGEDSSDGNTEDTEQKYAETEQPPKLSPEAQELQSLRTQYNQLLNALNDPKIKAAIQNAIAPAQNVEPPKQVAKEELSFDDLSEEAIADPKSFSKYLAQKVMAEVDRKVAKLLGEAEGKVAEVVKPILKDREQQVIDRTISDFKMKYKEEAELYLDGKSPHSQALQEVGREHPSLSLEQAFLMARGKMAKHDAHQLAQDIAKKKQAMTIGGSEKSQAMAGKTSYPKTPAEAANMVLSKLKS